MSGLQEICRLFGSIKASDGHKTTVHVWDYAQEVAVKEEEIPFGSERWMASERAKWAEIADHLKAARR